MLIILAARAFEYRASRVPSQLPSQPCPCRSMLSAPLLGNVHQPPRLRIHDEERVCLIYALRRLPPAAWMSFFGAFRTTLVRLAGYKPRPFRSFVVIILKKFMSYFCVADIRWGLSDTAPILHALETEIVRLPCAVGSNPSSCRYAGRTRVPLESQAWPGWASIIIRLNLPWQA